MNKKYNCPIRPNLKSLTDKYKDKYLSNEPFEHIYIKDIFSDEFLGDVYDEIWKQKNEPVWYKFCTNKWISEGGNYSKFGTSTVRLTNYLLSDEWVGFLRELTDIGDLRAHKEWGGSGINFEPRGSHLEPHLDFTNKYEGWRRVNILFFLSSKGWKKEWGGYAENFKKNDNEIGYKLVNSYKPEYNSLVIFSASDTSYHGFDIVRCPEDEARIAITAYYYSNERGPHTKGSGMTKYVGWDEDRKKDPDYSGRKGTDLKKLGEEKEGETQ